MAFETFEKLPDEKKEMIVSAGIRAFAANSYADAGTDLITKQCGISKGLLFHYFGSKKNYYLYCLETSMQRLTESTPKITAGSFYGVLFSAMEQKMDRCRQYPDEMHMVNMASRDACAAIEKERSQILGRYAVLVREGSAATLKKAVSFLKLKDAGQEETAVKGMQIYVSAVMNTYLLRYQQEPDGFFEHSEEIRKEMKSYLDLMLYGIAEKGEI